MSSQANPLIEFALNEKIVHVLQICIEGTFLSFHYISIAAITLHAIVMKKELDMTFRFVTAMALALSSVATTSYAADADIVDTAVGAGTFNTLVAAVGAADLVDVLKGDGPFTVFAPTDEAFAALPEGTVENLLKPENKDQLIAVLTYHVISGKVMSTDLEDDMMAATVQGSSVTIDLDNGVMVDGANVVAADIEATNGVIHVIDAVILPQG